MQHNYLYKADRLMLVPMDKLANEKYRQLRNRDDNRKFFINSSIITKDQQEKWFNSYLTKKNEYMFSIVQLNSHLLIGAIGIYNIDSVSKQAEIGRIIIDKNLAAGKGYGTESIIGLSRIAEKFLKLETVYAYIYTFNFASQKAFLRAGFLPDSSSENTPDLIKFNLKLI